MSDLTCRCLPGEIPPTGDPSPYLHPQAASQSPTTLDQFLGVLVNPPSPAVTTVARHDSSASHTGWVPVVTGIVADGTTRSELINYLSADIAATGGTLDRFVTPPVIHIASGATDQDIDATLQAVQMINASLPDTWQLSIAPNPRQTSDYLASPGEILMVLADRDEWEAECHGLACANVHPLYNSCRNRHCPTCQGLAARRWLHARAADILPVPYFHIVFTLPHEIAAIASANRTVVFNLLFRTAIETLRTIAADTRHGATRIGGTAVLHTWNQLLLFHPHLHCVVPNAGFDVDTGQWKTGSATFFAPVKVLASLFRRRFLEELARAHAHGRIQCHGTIAHLANPAQFHAVLANARSKDWNVYAKRPFRNTKQVFRYLSRYTHRIAISDSRITGFDADNVAFRYRKPTRHGHRKPRYAITTVTAEEFIRRFLLHALPRGLHRIRHFGILANGSRAQTLDIARRALGVAEQDHHTEAGHPPGTTEEESPDHDTPNLTAPRPCPHCSGVLRHVREIPLQRLRVSSRDPPCTEPAQSHSR